MVAYRGSGCKAPLPIKFKQCAYLGVHVSDALALLAIEALVDFGVAEVVFSNDGLIVFLRLVSLRCGLLNLLQEVFLFEP